MASHAFRSRRLLAVAVAVICAGSALVSTPTITVSAATFTDAGDVSGNVLSTAVLAAPGDPTVTTANGELTLTWTATPTTWADGYKIYRAADAAGPFTEVGSVAGRDTLTWTDTTPPAGTSHYVVKAYRVNWLSGQTQTGSGTPIITVSDTFAGTGALGTTEVGSKTWEFPNAATWSRNGSGRATSSSAADTNPMAVVDTGTGDVDAKIDTTGNGGEALYFRVGDGSNWLRARTRWTQSTSSYQYYNTEYQHVSYQTEYQHNTYTTEYEYADKQQTTTYTANGWVKTGSSCITSSHQYWNSQWYAWNKHAASGYFQNGWQTWTGPAGVCASTRRYAESYSQSISSSTSTSTVGYYWGTSARDGIDTKTGASRQVLTSSYWSTSYCSGCATRTVVASSYWDTNWCSGCATRQVGPYTGYSTTNTYNVVVEKSVAGTLSTLATYTPSSMPSTVRVECVGDQIKTYLNGSATPTGTVTEAAHQVSTKHGFGYGGPTQFAPNGVDGFSVSYLP